MNISNLSQETLIKLVELAIASAPTKAAYILLEGIPVIETPPTKKDIEVESIFFDTKMEEINRTVIDVYNFAQKGLRVDAIKLLRSKTGMGLKEARDAIAMGLEQEEFSVYNTNYVNRYWYEALNQYHKNRTFLKPEA